jgi:streptogramin lyase
MLLTALAAVGFAVPSTAAAAGDGGPEPGRLYESETDGDQSLALVRVGSDTKDRALVEIAATFDCEELSLEGVVLATVKRDGTFSAKSTRFALAGGGTDEVDADVEIRGRFENGAAGLTLDAKARAFDNAGTTGRCEAQSKWIARAGDPDPALERIAATTPLGRPAGALVAAGADAAYVATRPDEAKTARLHRVDAETGEPTWTVRPGPAIGGLAAGAEGVWVADGRRNRVLRLDPATGDVVAVIPLDLMETESQFGIVTAIVATDDAVWVAARGGLLHRIDPTTNTATTMNVFSEFAEDVVLGGTGNALYVGVELPPEPPDIPFGIFRVDTATGTPSAALPRAIGQLEALAPSDSDLWALLFEEGLARFDPESLTEVERIDVEGTALAAAAPGVWLITADGLEAYTSDTSSPAITIPIIGSGAGALAASADTVWVWDPRVGALTRVQAG